MGAKRVEAAMAKRTLISVVEDDQPFRESMRKLMTALGYTVEAFPSAADFLASPLLTATACLVSDVQMPGMTGIELHRWGDWGLSRRVAAPFRMLERGLC